MCKYTSSRGKSNRPHCKSELQLFSLIPAVMLMSLGASILSSINLLRAFRQITQERCAAQA